MCGDLTPVAFIGGARYYVTESLRVLLEVEIRGISEV